MSSFISSFFNSFSKPSPFPIPIPSTELSDRTTPASQVDYDISHQTIRIYDDFDSLITDMTNEIKKSETIIQKDESLIHDPKQLIKLKKYKSTLNKLIHSLQHKIQAISNHSMDLNNDIVIYLNESLQNVRVINNLCNQIYDNSQSTQTD